MINGGAGAGTGAASGSPRQHAHQRDVRRGRIDRRETGRQQEFVALGRHQAELARQAQHVLGRARARDQPLLPAEDGLALHADRAGQLGIGDAGAGGVLAQEFGKGAHGWHRFDRVARVETLQQLAATSLRGVARFATPV